MACSARFRSWILALAIVLLSLLDHGNAYMPPGGMHPGYPGHRRSAFESIEFNGINVLYEDLMYGINPVQQTHDITWRGINVEVRNRMDEIVMYPNENHQPPSPGRMVVVHNITRKELAETPLRQDRQTQTNLRAKLTFDAPLRRRLKFSCKKAACVVHVVVANRYFGTPITVELGQLKFTKTQGGRVEIALKTLPKLVESAYSDHAWPSWIPLRGIFHLCLALGAALMLLVGTEAWNSMYRIDPKCDTYNASRRWLIVSLTATILYFTLSLARALEILGIRQIMYIVPVCCVVGLIGLFAAGGGVEEEEYSDPFGDELPSPVVEKVNPETDSDNEIKLRKQQPTEPEEPTSKPQEVRDGEKTESKKGK